VTAAGLDDAGRAAMEAPVCELLLARGDRRGQGWIDARTAVLATPDAEGEPRYVQLPPRFLPDALARVNDLAPRPRVEPAVRLRFGAAALAEILAARDADRAGREGGEAAERMVRELREHWSVEARWAPAAGSPGVRIVEVLDTDGGLWLVVPDEPEVELWPTTPTAVFRMICALLPRDRELGAHVE
jgi:hypothetical protein